MTLSLLHCCSWSRDMGFAEAVLNGQDLGDEMMRLVQVPSPLPRISCGEEILLCCLRQCWRGKKLIEIT